MQESLFEHYVMGGGWVMLLLIPLSLVAVATILRGAMALSGGPVRRLAVSVETRANAWQTERGRGTVHLADLRIIASDGAMQLYGILQPLPIIYALAPVLGALGALWKLGRAWHGEVSLKGKLLELAVENAFIPLGWGLVISLVSIVGFGLLKARLLWVEANILVPAAMQTMQSAPERKSGERKL